jgi:predicted AAA+ superfamily ATPase
MPEAVASYRDNKDFAEVGEVHREILRSYELDFSKHVASPNDTLKISAVWHSLPQQLGKENKKFIYSVLRKSARGREYEAGIQWLNDANLISKVNQISKPAMPLKAYANTEIFKTYALDVGILGALCELKPQTILQKNKLFEIFHGAFIENLVAQELTAAHQQQLYYWSSEGKAEVDFLMEYYDHIYPLEVKSGLSKYKRSLLAYKEKYNPELICRTSPRNLKRDNDFINYPLYLSCLFPTLNVQPESN